MTNRKFMTENETFRKACDAVSFNPTIRQASKFRNSKGIVFKTIKNRMKGEANARSKD